MSYYDAKTLSVGFSEAVQRVETALQQEGFGVISRIDIQDTLKAKINVDFRSYVILGACNPQLAYEALQIDDKVGTMLPCNVIIQDVGHGQTEIAAVDPVASMAAINNPQLKLAAERVREKLRKAVGAV